MVLCGLWIEGGIWSKNIGCYCDPAIRGLKRLPAFRVRACSSRAYEWFIYHHFPAATLALQMPVLRTHSHPISEVSKNVLGHEVGTSTSMFTITLPAVFGRVAQNNHAVCLYDSPCLDHPDESAVLNMDAVRQLNIDNESGIAPIIEGAADEQTLFEGRDSWISKPFALHPVSLNILAPLRTPGLDDDSTAMLGLRNARRRSTVRPSVEKREEDKEEKTEILGGARKSQSQEPIAVSSGAKSGQSTSGFVHFRSSTEHIDGKK